VPRQLLQGLQGRGYRGGFVSAQHLVDLQEDIEARHRDGLFDAEFYEERLTSFEFQAPDSLPGAISIFVVAVPDPAVRITFTRNGEQLPFVVPPTYLHWREIDRRVEEAGAEILAPGGYHVAQADLPKKLTAVRSGLASYGKNNVTYVPGMGSFHRLVVLWSDLPSREDNWHELRMMDACQKCQACQRACPTEAIDPDRFLLHAERCMTFLNEKPPDVPFPAWVDPSWHNCLVGCLQCQRACPENKKVKDWVVGDEVFSEEETALILEGTTPEHLPPKTKEKLERLDLIDLLDVLPRNLRALLGDQVPRPTA
jgi:epoxyqueuosine reductase